MKKYNLINNTIGWLVFVIAAATYLLTIEPTASFWDCPEFIAQGFKAEIGHPPGNPIFILAARFAANFAGGDVTLVAKCVNAMSALFSAATILLLFWTVTHLAKRLIVTDGEEDQMKLSHYLVIMGCGICGALAYTWSDTFWFSAVEAEVYAFSSFCTALVFWLILKWENRADGPGSDRWLILIAFIFGVSLGVHLLNLLCIPAIALVYYYRKFDNTNLKGSIITLLVSFAIILIILYGLEPGFVKWAQKFDLFAVNTMGMRFNSGVLIYAIVLIGMLAWSVYEAYAAKSELRMKISFALAMFMSGMFFIGGSIYITLLLLAAFLIYLFKYLKAIKTRRFVALVALSVLVIFIGFASYGVILIRSNANTPLDENSPNNVFSLEKYLSREQYGETPLLYGRTLYSSVIYDEHGSALYEEGPTLYAEEVKTSPDQPDKYYDMGPKKNYVYSPEQNMLFPRIHSEAHIQQYRDWLGLQGQQVMAVTRVNAEGEPQPRLKPTMAENLRFFFDYQVNYMYWRYFMWNFSGRQNDIQGMGEITHGNWISGIPFIDNPRLGDQSLLPDDLGKGNKGHNVFYMLPLLMGIIGLLWQAYRRKRGIEQFWVIFFLFFMTGIAIVLYLNQTPSQPRERDYAYAGSFYAFAIWIGLGVAGIWRGVLALMNKKKGKEKAAEDTRLEGSSKGLAIAGVAALIGLLVPLQMVSQTWDDHDRSGRYAARDFGMNYLASLDKDAVIFTNGDNDTFPLWYAQEVEGYRTDVRVVNLSYLSTDWYIAQMQRAAYDSKPLPMQAGPTTYAYDNRVYSYFITPDTSVFVPVSTELEHLYSPNNTDNAYGLSEIRYPLLFIPANVDQAVAQGVISPEEKDMAQPDIRINLMQGGRGGMTSSQLMSLDIINSSIEQGWKRPCYFAMTVPESYYLGLQPYLRNTGMAYQVTPLFNGNTSMDYPTRTDKMYENITKKFRWGGLDIAKPGSLYLDETINRMVTTIRTTMLSLANDLANEAIIGKRALDNGQNVFQGKNTKEYIADRLKKAEHILDLMMEKLPAKASPLNVQIGQHIAQIYTLIAQEGGNPKCKEKAVKLLETEIDRYADYVRFYQSLSPTDYDRLTNVDKFIDQHYLGELIMAYGELNEAGFEQIEKKLTAKGVNLERAMSSLLQRQQAMQQAEQQVEEEMEE